MIFHLKYFSSECFHLKCFAGNWSAQLHRAYLSPAPNSDLPILDLIASYPRLLTDIVANRQTNRRVLIQLFSR